MDEPFPPPQEDPTQAARQNGTGHQGETCALTAAEVAALERLCAFIDTLCAALLAEFMPRTWFGGLFRRHVADPLAARICAALGGMGDKIRQIAAEGLCAPAEAEAPAMRGAEGQRGGEGRNSEAPCGEVGRAPKAAHGAALMRPTATAAEAVEPTGASQSPSQGHHATESKGRASVPRPNGWNMAWTNTVLCVPAHCPAHRPALGPSCRDGPAGNVFLLAEEVAHSHGRFVAIS